MYEDHLGLAARPFQLTPDPRWSEAASHRKTMAYPCHGLAQGKGFSIVFGDVGAGRTTLVVDEPQALPAAAPAGPGALAA